ncbi:thiolase family protein [Gordonia sp. NPDC127522]|uniref:thiolase family protein n=1 Tax=Gordonia sp. NPDC127522 TaxID=3345390 RepID=UPI0036323240
MGDGMLDTAGARGVLKAAAAISSGLCDIAVVGGGMAGKFGGGRGPVGAAVDPVEFVDVWGAYSVPLFALVAQGHMRRFGTTAEQLATAAATIRSNGSKNPEAMMFGKGPYTPEDVLASPMVATPFHLLDVCLTGEGGAAVVLTSSERARDLPHTPVRVLGAGMEFAGNHGMPPVDYESVGRLGVQAAERACGLAGIAAAEADVFELYDPNSFELIRQLEVIGLCEEGEGGAFVEAGSIALDGPYPTNPEGGCLSHSWNGTQHMTLKVAEATRQLRGTAVNQLPAPELAVVANAGSGTRHFETLVLGKD